MSGVKRWAQQYGTPPGSMRQDPAGDWVHIADHEAEVARLTSELEAAKAKLRDEFAGRALAGMAANPMWDDDGWGTMAEAAYDCADEMLAARAKGDAE